MSADKKTNLQLAFVKQCLEAQVADDIHAMADHVRSGFEDGAVAGVLVYGSCLRGVSTADSLIDFYVLVHRADQVSSSKLSSMACKVLPPNVYYAETAYEERTLRTKFAVLDVETFGAWMKPKTKNPYFWARFSQPCGLMYFSDEEARDKIASHIRQAIETMYGYCLSFAGSDKMQTTKTNDLWQNALIHTYQTELRAEGPSRAAEIVERNSEYYQKIAQLFNGVRTNKATWFLRRVQGKTFSILRLLKASMTFTGGADYLAWKISRHSGVEVTLKPWQRRHPIIGALFILPGLLRKGAIK